MIATTQQADAGYRAKQALWIWGVFIVLTIIINGTIPFAFGADVREWTASTPKSILTHIVNYAGMFLMVPLIATKGWRMLGNPGFLVPMLIAVLGIGLRPFAYPTAALVVVALAYLHWRYDLSDLGIRSRGRKGDVLAILILGLISFVPVLPKLDLHSIIPAQALLAGVDRLFTNPASTTENLFYFGFLTERLSQKTGKWLTAPLIGAMYTAHEMSNPEYWYQGMPFVLVFGGITVAAAVFLWRRNLVANWLGDGLSRAVSRLF